MASGTPAADTVIDATLVTALLRDQHPDLAGRPLLPNASGWDNVMFRLGDDLAVRLPRRRVSAALVEHEQRWLPELAPRLPFPVPVPVRAGRPGRSYPWAWSVVHWLDGRTADLDQPDPSTATDVAAFLRALHRPAPDDAPENPHRGVPLRDKAESVCAAAARLAGHDHVDAAARIFRAAADVPLRTAAVWVHGDLHPRNVLVSGGRISGVIDWGDLTAGDPSVDLSCAWALYEAPGRRDLRRAYGGVDALWRRAAGWAVFFGLVLLDTGLTDDRRFTAAGRRILRRVVEDDGGVAQ